MQSVSIILNLKNFESIILDILSISNEIPFTEFLWISVNFTDYDEHWFQWWCHLTTSITKHNVDPDEILHY